MKLNGSTKSKITKDKDSENVPHLEIVELVLVHCNLANNPPGMRHRSDVSFRSYIGQDVVDHAETIS